MKIRSITYFCNPKYPFDESTLRKAGEFLSKAKSAFETVGYEVQTVRLATIPFPKLLGEKEISQLPKFASDFSKAIQEVGILYASLGPALPELPKSYQVIPESISASENIFFSGVMTSDNNIHLAQVKACAEIIVQNAPLDANGFANLRFAALANVKAGAPFFPAAYWNDNESAFAIAVESADVAIKAFETESSLGESRSVLISEIEKQAQVIEKIAKSELSEIKFLGIDFSLAPFPDDAHSLGNAVEKMGVKKIGLHGSLASAAILTEAIERANFLHVGFNGFMQPVLEDSVLAKRAADGTLTIKDALLYSAVCGTGLDTIPLSGDVSADEIAPLLLDLCALALRLNKPLTARLMPIPNKRAGDETNFDFPFFANSKVMKLESESLQRALGGDESFELKSKL
ncbi:MAG: ACR protein [Chloroflexi bacterium OLB14]|nr:MAG: ACR protein [Chloroflexi bacterium OLB14]